MTGFYLNERIMQLRVEEEHRQAGFRRLQKEIGADRAGWLARQRTRTLSRLGRFLVSSGQRLLQPISPPPPSAEGRASRGA